MGSAERNALAHVQSASLSRRRTRSLRNTKQPMAPAATNVMSAGRPASISEPTKISNAIASRNANTGLSRMAVAMIDNFIQVARRLKALCPLTLRSAA